MVAKMDYNRLIAFGCSFTYGQYLPDDTIFLKPDAKSKKGLVKSIQKKPSKYAWPNILGEKLNIPVVINESHCGQSNKAILHDILNYKFDKNDIVFILWSNYDRHDVFTAKDHQWNINLYMSNLRSKVYFKYMHNKFNTTLENYFYFNLAHSYLKEKNIKHEFLLYHDRFLADFKWNKIKFLDVFFSRVNAPLPKAYDDLHPGVEAHKQFGNLIYQKYKNSEYYTGDIK